MKNILIFFFLCSTFSLLGQKNSSIHVMTSIGRPLLDEGQQEGFVAIQSETTSKSSMAYSLSVFLEHQQSEKFTLLYGLRYSKLDFHTDFQIGFYYGGLVAHRGETVYVNTPKLANVSYHSLSLPFAYRDYYRLGKRFSFYMQYGLAVNLSLGKKEVYKDYKYDGEAPYFETVLIAEDKKINLLGTHVELASGFTYRLNATLSLTIQAQLNLFEYRRVNKLIAEIGPYGNLNKHSLWKDHIVNVGQLAFGFGIQKRL